MTVTRNTVSLLADEDETNHEKLKKKFLTVRQSKSLYEWFLEPGGMFDVSAGVRKVSGASLSLCLCNPSVDRVATTHCCCHNSFGWCYFSIHNSLIGFHSGWKRAKSRLTQRQRFH